METLACDLTIFPISGSPLVPSVWRVYQNSHSSADHWKTKGNDFFNWDMYYLAIDWYNLIKIRTQLGSFPRRGIVLLGSGRWLPAATSVQDLFTGVFSSCASSLARRAWISSHSSLMWVRKSCCSAFSSCTSALIISNPPVAFSAGRKFRVRDRLFFFCLEASSVAFSCHWDPWVKVIVADSCRCFLDIRISLFNHLWYRTVRLPRKGSVLVIHRTVVQSAAESVWQIRTLLLYLSSPSHARLSKDKYRYYMFTHLVRRSIHLFHTMTKVLSAVKNVLERYIQYGRLSKIVSYLAHQVLAKRGRTEGRHKFKLN